MACKEVHRRSKTIPLPGRLKLSTMWLTASRSNQLSYGSLCCSRRCFAWLADIDAAFAWLVLVACLVASGAAVFCMAGVAVGDIDVAGVALADIDVPFVWQVWHLWHLLALG